MTNNRLNGKVSFLTKLQTLLENALFLGIAVVGIIDSYTAAWGGGSRIASAGVFPRIVFIVMAIGAIGMFFSKNKYIMPSADKNIPILFTALFLLWVGIYVWCALNIGFVTSTAVFLLITITAVTTDPMKHWKGILIATVIATVAIWAIFVKVIGIALPDTPLF